MTILVSIIDTETTSTADDAVAIEVACLQFDLDTATTVASFASLLRCDHNEAEAINHIPVAALRDAPEPDRIWPTIARMIGRSTMALAHNADFDRRFIPPSALADKPLVDTCNGVTWPRATRPGANLVQVALEHGLGVVDPHGALVDCQLLARLLRRCAELGYDLQALLARGLRPTAMFAALVPFEEKDKARDAGFKWSPEKRQWLRRLAIEDAASLPFKVAEV